jgi:hypothetical protein
MKPAAIPRPIGSVVLQIGGPLVIVEDANHYYWLVSMRSGRMLAERFEGPDAVKREAASLAFIHNPDSPPLRWSKPIRGVGAQAILEKGRG